MFMVRVSFFYPKTHSLYLSITHTHRDTSSSGGVTHGQDGDVLGPVQPPDRCPGLADPLHHGHIMFPVKSIIITVIISSSVILCTLSGMMDWYSIKRNLTGRLTWNVHKWRLDILHRLDMKVIMKGLCNHDTPFPWAVRNGSRKQVNFPTSWSYNSEKY